jgi:chromosome segregation ATPase
VDTYKLYRLNSNQVAFCTNLWQIFAEQKMRLSESMERPQPSINKKIGKVSSMSILEKFTHRENRATDHRSTLEQRSQQLTREHAVTLRKLEALQQRIESLDRAYRVSQTLFERHEDDRIKLKMRQIREYRSEAEQQMRSLSALESEFPARIAATQQEIEALTMQGWDMP